MFVLKDKTSNLRIKGGEFMDSAHIKKLISKFSKSVTTFICGLVAAYIGGMFFGEIGLLIGVIAFIPAVFVAINSKEI